MVRTGLEKVLEKITISLEGRGKSNILVIFHESLKVDFTEIIGLTFVSLCAVFLQALT